MFKALREEEQKEVKHISKQVEEYNNLDTTMMYNMILAENLVGCDITVIIGDKQYGNQTNLKGMHMAPGLRHMDKFNLRGCPGYIITDGLVLFWTQELGLKHNILLLESIAKQIDLAVENYNLTKKLNELATTDALTKLYNRRHFMELFQIEIDSAVRYKTTMGFTLLDIDKFKTYNDTFGHPAGDDLLRNIAVTLTSSLRSSDIVGRLGGEEFGILFKGIRNEDEAAVIANKIRKAVEIDLNTDTGKALRQVTISMGVSIFQSDSAELEHLYKIADERLYKAKETGRNKVVWRSE